MVSLNTAEEYKEYITSCTLCSRRDTATQPVPFRGRPSSIMVLGEAPGRREDERGRPFVGPAGKLLFDELAKVGIERRDVFTANTVCCYSDHTPDRDEIYACRRNLWYQTYWCNPKVILAVGKIANYTLGQNVPMKDLRGKWYDLSWFATDNFPGHDLIEVFPTYHPAAVLRNRALTRRWREDLQTFASEAL